MLLTTVLHNGTAHARACAPLLDEQAEEASYSFSQAPTAQQIIHNFYNYLSSLQKCTSSVDLVQVPNERFVILPIVIMRLLWKADKENGSLTDDSLSFPPPYPPSYYVFALKRIII